MQQRPSIKEKDERGASKTAFQRGEISHGPSPALSLISKAPVMQRCWKVETLKVWTGPTLSEKGIYSRSPDLEGARGEGNKGGFRSVSDGE